MANPRIKRSSTNPIGSVGTVAFGELVMTDVSGTLKLYGTDSANAAQLLIEEGNGSNSQFWRGDGTWATPAGSGDVSFNAGTAPADNALVRFDGTSGTSIQESGIIIDDSENITGVNTLNTHTIPGGTGTLALTTDIPTLSALTAGTGIAGGPYDGSGAVTFNLDFSELTDKTTAIAGTTEFIIQDGTTESRKAASEIDLSAFNNDSNWTANAGTVTSVDTGNGLSGGAITGSGTINIAAHAGSAGTIGTVTVNASGLGVTLGSTSTTAAAGDHNHSGTYEPADSTIIKEGSTLNATNWSWVDNGSVATGSATQVPTQAAVKSYVDAVAASEMTYQGGYAASANPNSSASVGDVYTVTVAGTGIASFWSTPLEIGDLIIAETNNPVTEADWTVVQKNLDGYVLDTRNINTNANSGLAGGGDLSADRSLSMDVNNLTTITSIDGSADYVPVYDAGVGTRNILINNFLDGGTF